MQLLRPPIAESVGDPPWKSKRAVRSIWARACPQAIYDPRHHAPFKKGVYTHTRTGELTCIPAARHKAMAEASKMGNYRRSESLWYIDGRANPLMDRKVVGVVLFGLVLVVASPTTGGFNCSCRCSVVAAAAVAVAAFGVIVVVVVVVVPLK